MAMKTRGRVKAVLTQKRRRMSTNSGFSPSSVETGVRGSSAMPQMGQLPGASRTISGCMGQVYLAPVVPWIGLGELRDVGVSLGG